ncbi:MAG: polysaccharide deacetylase family protein [Bacillota bacterium]
MRMFYIDKGKMRAVFSAVFVLALCVGAWAVNVGDETVTTAARDNTELLAHVTSAGNPKNSGVSLLFSVDENTDINTLAETMQILADNKIKATFFLTGKFAEKHADVVLSMQEFGHEIGVSGYEAVSPGNLDYAENLTSLEKASTVIRNITNQAAKYYSPPFGVLEEDIYNAVNESELTFVLAGVDSLDWDDVSTEAVISTVLTKAEKGSLISLHSTEMTNLGLQTIINELKGLKLKFLTVSENVGK